MTTGPISLPAPATSGSAAVPAPGSSMSGTPRARSTDAAAVQHGELVPYGNGTSSATTKPQFITPGAGRWSARHLYQLAARLNTPALYAMSDSAAYFGYLGVQDICDRGVALGNYLKHKIAAQWGPKALWVEQNPDPTVCHGPDLPSIPSPARDDPSPICRHE